MRHTRYFIYRRPDGIIVQHDVKNNTFYMLSEEGSLVKGLHAMWYWLRSMIRLHAWRARHPQHW